MGSNQSYNLLDPVTFRVQALRFVLTAKDVVRFPIGKPGNILRGALGTIFRRLACTPDCPGAKECERREICAYARVFEPSARGAGPSGLTDWPRPFVFRAGHLDGTTVHPGDSFHFDLNVFEMHDVVIPYFVQAFSRLAREGLGPNRGRAELEGVHQLDETGALVRTFYDREADALTEPGPPLTFDLSPATEPVERLRVHFDMPTELKVGKRLAQRPDFRVLFARARDRVSTLRTLYQDGPLEIDFQAMGRRATEVSMTRCEVQWRDVMRHSSKTGQSHNIGGFVGEAEYEGDLAEFYPFLHVCQWTGVGRHTVWGKGALTIERL